MKLGRRSFFAAAGGMLASAFAYRPPGTISMYDVPSMRNYVMTFTGNLSATCGLNPEGALLPPVMGVKGSEDPDRQMCITHWIKARSVSE
jgi:hypothetical protein